MKSRFEKHHLVGPWGYRFIRIERIAHWVNAVSFFILVFSGLLLFFRYRFNLGEDRVSLVWNVHIITAGFYFLGPALLFFASDPRAGFSWITEAFKWSLSEFIWLTGPAQKILCKWLPVPMVGRFNAGQRMNLMGQLAGKWIMAITGCIILFFPGRLIIYYIHVVFALLLVFMALGHMYMAMINPSTRHAFFAMIHGFVKRDWLSHHHPAWVKKLPEADSLDHLEKKPGSKNMLILVFAFLACSSSLTAQESKVTWYESLLSPGPQVRAHQNALHENGCIACHDGSRTLSDEICLECHEPIRERMKKKTGVHGKFTDPCIQCHKDHRGEDYNMVILDEETFNHDTALYLLKGKHRDLECHACHEVKKEERKFQTHFYIGLSRECSGCHDDPHTGQFQRKCLECHREEGWKGDHLIFDHSHMSTFPLEGGHQTVDCEKCHEAMKTFKPLKTSCAACHEDPHEGQFAADKDCETCHVVDAWKIPHLNFAHDRDSAFPLTGAHLEVECAKCHEQKYRNKKTACIDCHVDPHEGQFAHDKDCEQCHQTAGWKGGYLLFDHQIDSKYPLTGRHPVVACESCHKEGRYRTGMTACFDCHTEDPHEGRLEVDCEKCHTTEAFKGDAVRFDHNADTEFALTPLHQEVSCVRCHVDSTYTVEGPDCKTCHGEAEAFFAGTLFPGQGEPMPDAMHGRVKCTDCHLLEDPKAAAYLVRPRCVKCHNPSYGVYLNESLALIAGRLQNRGLEESDLESDRIREAVEKYGPHNFKYTLELLGNKP